MTPALPDVPDLLRRYGLRPNKKLGQNFLVDAATLQRIVEAASLMCDEWVLEIGPGLGSLTCLLAARAQQVVAVELDAQLIPILKEVLLPYPNVRLVQGDILGFEPQALMLADVSPRSQVEQSKSYCVVANIPYYITSAVIRHLLEGEIRPRQMVLTVQREVAERIVAGPGEMSLLALSVQVYGSPRIVARIPAGAFYPPPEVDSAVVRVDLHPMPHIAQERLPLFFRLARAGFSQKRKTLRNALTGGMAWKSQYTAEVLEVAGIDGRRRAETLSLEEWSALVDVVLQQNDTSFPS